MNSDESNRSNPEAGENKAGILNGRPLDVFFRNLTLSKGEVLNMNARLEQINLDLKNDISKCRKTEQSLKQDEKQLRLFIENAPAAIAMCDCEMRYLAFSQRWLQEFDLVGRQVTGRTHGEVCPEAPELWMETLRRCLNGAVEQSGEDSFLRADGSVRWRRWETVPWFNEYYELGGLIIFTEDITERRAAESALKEREQKYRDVFNHMVEEVHLWKLECDSNGSIRTWSLVDANPPALKSWGKGTIDEIRGKTADEVFGPGWTEHYLPVVRKIMSEGIPYSHEDYFPDSRRYFKLTLAPMGNHFITTGTDITKIKQAEELAKNAAADVEAAKKELELQKADLECSNRDLEQFAYVASHDLQEPARMVASYVQLLVRRYRGKLDSDADTFIYYASDGAKRMQNLINDLLTYSRVSTKGKEFLPVSTEAILERVKDNLQLKIRETGAVVTYAHLPVVNADGGQIVQVFQNLVANGIKFHQGGTPRVHVSCELKDEEYVFSVRDNGIGIAPEYFDRIFMIFQRLHTREEYEGTGIGLAVCKRIVERHHGRIWIESQPGAGSTFYFTVSAAGTAGEVDEYRRKYREQV